MTLVLLELQNRIIIRKYRQLILYIEDITCPRVDMNFIFEWSTRYLKSERSERVRYRVEHEKIIFISISGHVIFYLLHEYSCSMLVLKASLSIQAGK